MGTSSTVCMFRMCSEDSSKLLRSPRTKTLRRAPNALGRRVGGKKELFAFPATQLEVSQLELPALPAWRWRPVFLNLQGFLCATNTKAVKIILLETQHSCSESVFVHMSHKYFVFLQKKSSNLRMPNDEAVFRCPCISWNWLGGSQGFLNV